MFIQFLEPRRLMSVSAATLTADVANVYADAKVVTADHATRYTTAKANYDAISSSLKVLDLNASRSTRLTNERLLLRLGTDDLISHARIVADMNLFLSTARVDSTLGGAHGKGLLLHSTSTAFQKLVANDISNLNLKVPARLATFEAELNDATATSRSDADAISAANPSLAGLISTASSNLSTADTALIAAANQVGTDTSGLATDLAAIPA